MRGHRLRLRPQQFCKVSLGGPGDARARRRSTVERSNGRAEVGSVEPVWLDLGSLGHDIASTAGPRMALEILIELVNLAAPSEAEPPPADRQVKAGAV